MKYFEIIVRWALGIMFIYSSIYKMVDPCSFSHVVANYKILPAQFLINLTAVYLPYIEVVCGVALLLNTRVKGASYILNVMLIVFIIAISINLLQGRNFDCGCFSKHDPDAQVSAVELLIRDFIFLAGTLFVYIWHSKKGNEVS